MLRSARRAAGRPAALLLCTSLLTALSVAAPSEAQPSYVLFEGGPVRPVALSPDGQKLFVANAPEAHLEIYDVGAGGALTPAGSVPVGLEPVAVAPRSNAEVWVVNHLSDSVSIVDVASTPPRVKRTLLVGDEPRDIVFAGSPLRAFISTAHRGQQRVHGSISGVTGAGNPQLTTEGVGRADVWVFDAASPGSALGGVPVEILTFFADTPRALATDGTTVYVAAFHSGNQTTAIPETAVPDGFATTCVGGPGGTGQGVPGPSTNDPAEGGNPAPETGLILKLVAGDWLDALGCSWNTVVQFDLPDHDVFAVNANTLTAGDVFDHVGTILFNMVVNPVTGKLYVTNHESPNDIRFEGPGDFTGSTVQGHLSETRVSVLDPGTTAVDPQHLNHHIDYDQLHTDAGADHAVIDAQIPHSLATPLQPLVSGDGGTLYVAAFGSAKVGVFDTSDIEDPLFDDPMSPSYEPTVGSANYIATGGGPAGLALNGADDRLYVYTRFDNEVWVYDVGGATPALIQTLKLPSAEPASVVRGRPFLYDAVATSGNGEASCASCHIFGDMDSLAWNLGNPDEAQTSNPQVVLGVPPGSGGPPFHPMKGPMTTQTLRGLSTHSALHWRGDRANGFFNGPTPANCTAVSQDACEEELSFNNFLPAFEGLIGGHADIPVTTPSGIKDAVLSDVDMQKFTDFALQLTLPPNPVANLDGTQTTEQSDGEFTYFNTPADGGVTCNFCHTLDPAQGFFGTDGSQTFEGEPQLFKVAHLRNAYQKIGMFGLVGETGHLGDQVRGFGFLHDGAIDTMFNFLNAAAAPFNLTVDEALDLEQFMLAFPSDVAPIVGQQMSVGPGSPGSVGNPDVNDSLTGRAPLLDARAGTSFDSLVLGSPITACELVVRSFEPGATRVVSYLRQHPSGQYQPDDGSPTLADEATLRALAGPAPGGADRDLDYLCVPPGSGQRMGLDRDLDSVPNASDNCPAWPNGAAGGTCTAGDPALLAAKCSASSECDGGVGGGVCSLAQEDGDGDGIGDACEVTVLPEPKGPLGLALGLGLLLALRRGGRGRRRPLS